MSSSPYSYDEGHHLKVIGTDQVCHVDRAKHKKTGIGSVYARSHCGIIELVSIVGGQLTASQKEKDSKYDQ